MANVALGHIKSLLTQVDDDGSNVAQFCVASVVRYPKIYKFVEEYETEPDTSLPEQRLLQKTNYAIGILRKESNLKK